MSTSPDNLDRLDLRSYRVHEADEVLVSDLTVKRVDISDSPRDGFRFDVIVEVEVEMEITLNIHNNSVAVIKRRCGIPQRLVDTKRYICNE